MKKTGLLCFLLGALLCGVPVFGSGESAPSALDRVYALSRKPEALSMPFTHRRFSTLFKEPQTRHGTFYFDGRETAVMAYTDPEPYVFLIRGGEAFHMRRDSPEPQALDLRKAPLMRGMAQMFRFDPDALKKMFEVTAEESADGKEILLHLVPRRPAPISKILLQVDVQSGLLRQLRMDETGGESQIIVFGEPDANPPAPECFLPSCWSERLKEPAT